MTGLTFALGKTLLKSAQLLTLASSQKPKASGGLFGHWKMFVKSCKVVCPWSVTPDIVNVDTDRLLLYVSTGNLNYKRMRVRFGTE